MNMLSHSVALGRLSHLILTQVIYIIFILIKYSLDLCIYVLAIPKITSGGLKTQVRKDQSQNQEHQGIIENL